MHSAGLAVALRRRTSVASLAPLVAGVLIVAGCESPVGEPVAAPATPPTPRAQLENVEHRLEEALEHARAASGSGVTSMRRCKFRLIEPTDKESRYTADVVIQTSVSLAPEPQAKPIGDVTDEPVVEEKRFFKLVYEHERWELAEPPVEELTDTERICFQSALSDG
jgi:hypothetical protein